MIALWTLSSLLGAIVSLFGVHEAWTDLRQYPRRENGRRLVGRQRLIAQTVRVFAFLAWFLLGALVWAASGPYGSGSLAVLVLVLTNLSFTGLSVLDFMVGLRLRRMP